MVSVDQRGERHPVFPYILRFKSTYTDITKTYSEVAGSAADKQIVLDYAPDFKIPYSSIYFNVQNTSRTEPAIIHHMVLTRIVYIDIYEELTPTKKMEILEAQLATKTNSPVKIY